MYATISESDKEERSRVRDAGVDEGAERLSSKTRKGEAKLTRSRPAAYNLVRDSLVVARTKQKSNKKLRS